MEFPTTRRLYEQEPETLVFTADVLACEARDGGYDIVLDRTAFFPEGGGQGADHGEIEGARVLDAHERDGVVRHLTDAPLPVGARVTGRVDAARRLAMTQQHSGEHIFSGLVHRLYGYDNVGFHIGSEAVTMDFNGPLSEEDARRVERLANEAVWADIPVEAFVPDRETLARMDYRSKKPIDGDVRIVRIADVDTCACCGTHVRSTGRVGQIKLLGVQRYKGGVRVSILCGCRALEEENALLDQVRRASEALSVKRHEVADAVEKLLAERDALRAKNNEWGTRLFELLAERERGEAVRVVACDALPASMARKAAGRLCEGAELALALIPREAGWSFALASNVRDVRPVVRALCEAFGGRGGGPKDMAQGVLDGGSEDAIRQKLRELAEAEGGEGHA